MKTVLNCSIMHSFEYYKDIIKYVSILQSCQTSRGAHPGPYPVGKARESCYRPGVAQRFPGS